MHERTHYQLKYVNKFFNSILLDNKCKSRIYEHINILYFMLITQKIKIYLITRIQFKQFKQFN